MRCVMNKPTLPSLLAANGLKKLGEDVSAARKRRQFTQRRLAEGAGVSLPTIQRMEASDGQVRGVVDTLVKVITAIERAGVELLGENAPSTGIGRGVRLRENTNGKPQGGGESVLYDKAAPGASVR